VQKEMNVYFILALSGMALFFIGVFVFGSLARRGSEMENLRGPLWRSWLQMEVLALLKRDRFRSLRWLEKVAALAYVLVLAIFTAAIFYSILSFI
jgi:hypothetical protein